MENIEPIEDQLIETSEVVDSTTMMQEEIIQQTELTDEEQQIVTSTIETETEEVNYVQEEQIYTNQTTDLHHEEGQLIIQDDENNDIKNIVNQVELEDQQGEQLIRLPSVTSQEQLIQPRTASEALLSSQMLRAQMGHHQQQTMHTVEVHTPSLSLAEHGFTTDMLDSQHHIYTQKPIVGQTSEHMLQQQSINIVDCNESTDYFTNLYQPKLNSGQSGEQQYHMQHHHSQNKERKSQFRKPPPEKFIHEGCMYNFISFSKNKRYKFWRCDKRSQGCKVRIHTDVHTNRIVKMRNIHNHDNDPKDVELKRLKAIVKVRALQCNDNPAQVIKQSLSELPNINFELNAIQKRNLAKVINRERSLVETTVPIAAPSIVEEGNISGDEIEEMEQESHHFTNLRPSSLYQHQDEEYKVISSRHSSNEQVHHCNYDGLQPTVDNPHVVQQVLVEFTGDLSDEDMMSLEQNSDTLIDYEPLHSSDGLLNINIVQDDPLMMPTKNEPEDYYFQDSLFAVPRTPVEKKPKEKLIEGGCMYAFDRHSTDGRVKFWRCDHRAHGCQVRLHTDATTNEIVKQVNMHNHEIDSRDVEIKKLKQILKRQALETDDDPRSMISEGIKILSEPARALVDTNHLEIFINRHRRTSIARDPSRIEHMQISNRYTVYTSEPKSNITENFLLHDCGPDAGRNRILVFGRESNVRDAGSEENNIKHVIFDGTFSLTPKVYDGGKLYIVMIRQDEWIFPFLYVLLPCKAPQIYSKFFNILKQLLPHLKPTTVSIDFEPDAYRALKRAFPTASCSGHFFHFAQAVKRQWITMSPEQHRRYCEDAEFAVLCKAVSSIALVPPQRIQRALCDLRHNLPKELGFLVHWLEDYFTGKPVGDQTHDPVFPVEMWNAYPRFLNDSDSTELADTNAEAAHRRIQTELGMNHSTVWKLIDCFRKVQRTHDAEFDQMISGNRPPTQPKKFRSSYAQMHKIVRSETDVDTDADVWPYMRDLSRIFEVLP